MQLLEKTLIRVGNDEYAKQNRSYGLTTLRNTHVEVNGRRVQFTFKGKSGVEHEIALDDRRLARIVKQCRDLPGYDLFQYIDDEGGRQTIESADVNAYLRSVSGDDYSSKDFRTWAGTVLATELLRDLERFQTESEAKKQIVSAVESVAKRLGNTKAVCRKCYIHPAVFEAFMDGSLVKARARVTRRIGALSEPEAAGTGDAAAASASCDRPARQLIRRAGHEADSPGGDLNAAVRPFDVDGRPAAVQPGLQPPAARFLRLQLETAGVDATVRDARRNRRLRIGGSRSFSPPFVHSSLAPRSSSLTMSISTPPFVVLALIDPETLRATTPPFVVSA